MKRLLLALFFVTSLAYGQCPNGDVILSTQADVDNFVATYPNCDILTNSLTITGTVNDLSALDYLIRIEEELIIQDTELTTISNFNTLTEVYNNISISNNDLLTTINGFNNLLHLSMGFGIANNPNLLTIDGFNNATDVFFYFAVAFNPSLQTISGFNNLQNVGEFISFNDCPALTSIPTFSNLTTIGWSVQFSNTGMTDISGFENITLIGGVDPTSGFVFSDNQNLVSITGFCSLQRVEYDFLIQDNPVLVDISGLNNLESVGQFFTIRNNASLATLNGFQSLTEISRVGYEGEETVSIHDNPMLSDCDALCNVLTSNQIIGTVNLYNNLTGCNTVAEINTTNCVVFETLACTSLSGPLDGDVNVAIDTNISWEPITGATYYLISIGTTSGVADIANRLDVGNITDYDLPIDLPGNTEIFVKVIPYNDNGNATCCIEESFTTENTITIECTTLTAPLNNETDVLISSDISWNTVAGATGYLISIGTSSGGTDIVDNANVGNATTYNPVADFPENTEIFVTITPYNATEQANNCAEESFTTETNLPDCTTLLNPFNQSTGVPIISDITWNAIANATGYLISVGTTASGNEIVNNIDVGNVTVFDPVANLPENAEIFVTITPYNLTGQASNCIEESFTTETTLPDCTTLSNPLDEATDVSIISNITWNAIANATGYLISIGTTSDGAEIADNIDVGNTTTYNPVANLPVNTEIFVNITPYNSAGQALNCSEESFITESEQSIPECTTLISPANGAINVDINSNMSWNASDDVTGYILNVGLTLLGSEIVDNLDVGNNTNYDFSTSLPEGTEIYVNIIPYNAFGQPLECVTESFITETVSVVIPPYFTPNGDVYHQTWKVIDTDNQISSISIFDRYGKLIKQLSPNSNGWDGTFNGNPMPTGGYWYLIGKTDGSNIRGAFTLKR